MLVSVRKIGISYFLVLERGVILNCCLVYYVTMLLITSKYYIHKKHELDDTKTAAEKDMSEIDHPELDDNVGTAAPKRPPASRVEATKKEYRHMYMRSNLIAVGSSTLFLAAGYLFNVDFIFTLTGYFYIAFLYLKYFDIFWKRKNAIWGILGFVAILFGSYHMVRSLPPLYHPLQKLHVCWWSFFST